MTDRTNLKRQVNEAIDARGDELVRLSKTILNNAEPGFREIKTAGLVADWLNANGLRPRVGVAMTGVVGTLDTGRPGPHVAVMGELDSLIVPGHAHANLDTGAAHACGHHAQIGSMLGVAAGLMDEAVRGALSGKVTFMATPAEEYIEIERREQLREQGKIEFLGGKQEFIRLGELDSVNIAMLTHTSSLEKTGFGVGGSNNGMLGKTVQFIGKAAHAGGSPHLGINALNAAHIALAGIHAQRETHRDADTVRVHPIITMGGASVNSVPADVRMETYVRAGSISAMGDASVKVDRALRAGAMAVGGSVRIKTIPGYLPAKYDGALTEVYSRNATALVGGDNVHTLRHSTGSTDMGDVSQLVATIQPSVFASSGNGHGVDYLVNDYDLAVVEAAKAMAMTVVDLLADDAADGCRIVESFRAPMTRPEYISRLMELRSDRTYSE
ncbi:MAG: amidohydrolase [Dehalococcoidia bacterium]